MARWKLTEKHYLNVPGTHWEFQTVDRMTGRPQRKTFNVPLFLDPEDKDCWNYRGEGMFEDGSIIVCHAGKGDPRDIVFEGAPTPGMLPLDDEAREISGKFSWTPTLGIDDESKQNSYQNKLLLGMIDQMAELQTKATQAPMAAGMEQFLESMTKMMAQQTEILSKLANPAALPPISEAQIIDEEPALPEAEPPTEEEIAASAAAFAEAERASAAKAAEKLARSSVRR